MSRFERYGFVRVALTGLCAVAVIAAHLVVFVLEVAVLGVALVYGWRLLGDWLARSRERRRVW